MSDLPRGRTVKGTRKTNSEKGKTMEILKIEKLEKFTKNIHLKMYLFTLATSQCEGAVIF